LVGVISYYLSKVKESPLVVVGDFAHLPHGQKKNGPTTAIRHKETSGIQRRGKQNKFAGKGALISPDKHETITRRVNRGAGWVVHQVRWSAKAKGGRPPE
jgi:hypothetical protein